MKKSYSLTYKDAGVNIDAGDECSKILFEASRATWKNRKGLVGEIRSESSYFGSLRCLDGNWGKDTILGMNSDGVGTKIELAERLNDHSTIAFDLFAMVCDDAAIRGAEPIIIASVLDFNTVNIDIVRQIAKGMINAARESKVSVINGELAELGNRVSGYGASCYNWSASVLWVARKSRILEHKTIKPGSKIIAVREKGIRSNGLSLIRKILSKAFGKDWHLDRKGREFAKWCLQPSRIYTPLLTKLHGGFCSAPTTRIYCAVHITGGGIPSKLGRVLFQSGKGAKLNDLFKPPENLLSIQKLGNVTDEECYKTWNMGQGLLVIADDSEAVCEIANKMGYESRLAGYITEGSEIIIKSRATMKKGKEIIFKVK